LVNKDLVTKTALTWASKRPLILEGFGMSGRQIGIFVLGKFLSAWPRRFKPCALEHNENYFFKVGV